MIVTLPPFNMKIFKDRQTAGKLLAEKLHFFNGRGTIVLGIPRGGVVVAAEIAKELKLPLDIIVTRKIPHPDQPELAIGAVDSDGQIIGEVGEYGRIREIVEKELAELKKREEKYRHARRPLAKLIEGKVVILVDDGIATGATTLAAINYLKRHGVRKIMLAVPVASREAVEKMIRELGEFGEVMVLETPENFAAVGQFYQEFQPVEDEEVIQLLANG